MATDCPRCSQTLPDGPPARSRLTADRQLTICSPCGTDEAVRDQAGLAPIPPTEWPLSR
ncbi:hypothetical protein ACFV0H_30145 [Streptomyces erythrochromogenes]|uniref:hypothetical protein n=1 Tax=Streptomyces erythrochromogenes TaxID=285574 RepID=UPI0036BD3CA6